MTNRAVPGWVAADWPAPEWVRAGTTTRCGGVSQAPYHSLNLGESSGDEPELVRVNRERAGRYLGLPGSPKWLNQMHGRTVTEIDEGILSPADADGAYTTGPGVVCAVLTADCLPILLCDGDGSEVAALHVGWRGLASGIIEAGLARLSVPADRILAWLGPAISGKHYEVDGRVRRAIMARHPECQAAFAGSSPGHWRLDLRDAARKVLHQHGICAVYGGEYCSYEGAERFFSFRRDGETGRMASLIWMEHPD